MDNSSLIDLDSTVEEAKTSVPLLPLPRINSPYEGDVLSDENNPFDWAVQAVSDVDDPFELVLKKAQELGSRKTGQSGIKDVSLLNCKNIENEIGMVESKKIVGIENKNVKREPECKNEMALCQNNHKITNFNTPDIVQSANYIPSAQPRNQRVSPESMKPKYCSTPVQVASAKRKLEEEYSPVLNKKASSNLFNISPASVVKARVERCIAEVEKRFKKQSQEKLKGRKSLDSLMSYYSNSNYQRETIFQHDYSLHERNSLDFLYSEDSRSELTNTSRNFQKPKNMGNFSEETFTFPCKVDSQTFLNSSGPGDDLSRHEVRYMATLFKATAEYREHCLANESIVNFADLDSEEDDILEKEEPKEIKEKLIAGFQAPNPMDLGVIKYCSEVKMPERTYSSPETEQMSQPNRQKYQATEKSSKSVMSKVLEKTQSFSPGKSTSSLKERFSVEGSGTVNNKLSLPKIQSNLNRSRSDSTVHSLKKKEQMEKTPRPRLKEPSRFSNVGQSPQTKQKQVVNSGRVNKPPKPLPKMFRNKKNLLAGKENKQ